MAQRRGSVAGTVPHISVSSHAPTTACALVSEQRGMLAYWQIDRLYKHERMHVHTRLPAVR